MQNLLVKLFKLLSVQVVVRAILILILVFVERLDLVILFFPFAFTARHVLNELLYLLNFI